MDLAEHIFPDSMDAIRSLANDRDTCFLVAKEVGKKLMEDNEFVAGFSFGTMSALMSQAWFASDEEECIAMSTMVLTLSKSKDVLPLVSVHKARSLAARCIVSLGLFKPALNRRHDRYGAPSPSFYRNVGISEFKNSGMDNISDHFRQWENFLNEMFVLDYRRTS
jgi:hypothetical protein